MSIIDELSDWQRKVLLAAECTRVCYPSYVSEDEALRQYPEIWKAYPQEFTKDWNAEQARVALSVLHDNGRTVFDCQNGEHDELVYITDEYAPYNIVLPDEPKPEPWTVGTLIAAIEDGREFKISSSGNPRIDPNWFNVRDHELSSANGWTIEEIV